MPPLYSFSTKRIYFPNVLLLNLFDIHILILLVIEIIEKIFVYTWFFLLLGADNDVEGAKEFIKNKYLELVEPRQTNPEKNIYPHYTCSVG